MDIDAYIKEPLPFDDEISNFFATRDTLTIFDIGACEGEDSIRLKKRFPNSAVYTFEPLPENCKKVRNNFTRYGLTDETLFQIALSDTDGSADFHVSSGHPDNLPQVEGWDYGNKSSSLLPPKEHKKTHPWIKFDKKINVKTKRLDTFCSEQAIDKIDFIYIDVQGAELMVLEGAGGMLENIGAVWMEVEAVELYKGQPLKTDVEKFMDEYGFERIKDTVDQISGDQLYVRRGLPKASRKSKIYRIIGNKLQH